uniref:Uncharacterized protein n=1 Tax=Arundo donax TaxID=35708 RepID=A0A0A9AS40_ARUDO
MIQMKYPSNSNKGGPRKGRNSVQGRQQPPSKFAPQSVKSNTNRLCLISILHMNSCSIHHSFLLLLI